MCRQLLNCDIINCVKWKELCELKSLRSKWNNYLMLFCSWKSSVFKSQPYINVKVRKFETANYYNWTRLEKQNNHVRVTIIYIEAKVFLMHFFFKTKVLQRTAWCIYIDCVVAIILLVMLVSQDLRFANQMKTRTTGNTQRNGVIALYISHVLML